MRRLEQRFLRVLRAGNCRCWSYLVQILSRAVQAANDYFTGNEIFRVPGVRDVMALVIQEPDRYRFVAVFLDYLTDVCVSMNSWNCHSALLSIEKVTQNGLVS